MLLHLLEVSIATLKTSRRLRGDHPVEVVHRLEEDGLRAAAVAVARHRPAQIDAEPLAQLGVALEDGLRGWEGEVLVPRQSEGDEEAGEANLEDDLRVTSYK